MSTASGTIRNWIPRRRPSRRRSWRTFTWDSGSIERALTFLSVRVSGKCYRVVEGVGMRSLFTLVLGSAMAVAQTAPAPPLLRGVLLECDPQAPGQFSVRAADH